MLNVITSKELCENYVKISEFCHECDEPIVITNDGKDDLVIMSIDVYEQMVNEVKARLELYTLIEAGFEDIRQGRVIPIDEAFAELWNRFDEDFGGEISEP